MIIPAHDAADTLPRQLGALASQPQPREFEVIVVANRCNDATVEIARGFSGTLRLEVEEADDRASAAYARNIGAGRASAPFLLFCDADDEVGIGWVTGMLDPLQTGTADFVAGCIRVDRSGLPAWMYRWRYAAFDGRCVLETRSLPYVMSASLGITAEAFAAVGGFDPRFDAAGAEEMDLAWRLLRAGYRIGEAPAAVVSYRPRHTLREGLEQSRRYRQGELTLLEKEGAGGAAPSPSRPVRRFVRSVGKAVIRSLDVHPLGIYARSREKLDGWVDFHRWERERRDDPPRPGRSWSDFGVRTSTPIIGGLAFAADRLDDARWYASAGVESTSLAMVERFLPKGGTFVDVGANIGVFSVAAAKRVGHRGRVVAFEPTARNRTILEHNLGRHGVDHIVGVHPEAVGAEAAERILRVYENGLVSGFGEAPTAFFPGRLVDETPVQVIPLSEVVEGPVDMIKIDVEGFETEVLDGASELLGRSPDAVLIVEFNPAALAAAGKHPAELLSALPASRWDLWLLDETDPAGTADSLTRFDREEWATVSGSDQSWYANLLATPVRRST